MTREMVIKTWLRFLSFPRKTVMSKHRLCWLLGKQKSRFCFKYESFWGNGTCLEKNQEPGLSLQVDSQFCYRLTNSLVLQSFCAPLNVKWMDICARICSEMWNTLKSKTSNTLWMCKLKNGRKHSLICSNQPTKHCLDKKQLFGEEELDLEFILWGRILREDWVMLTARLKKPY